MNSTNQKAAHFKEELNKSIDNKEKKKRIQHMMQNYGNLRKNWKAMCFMASILEVQIDSLLVQKTVEGRSERRAWK